jgi:hypothetical protein
MQTFPLTIIIPVHELTAETTPLLETAVYSIESQQGFVPAEVLVVAPASLASDLGQIFLTGIERKATYKVVTHEGATDIASQVNAAIAQASTEYVTILEFDDELGNQYIAEMALHVATQPEVEAWLPLIACVDTENRLLKHGNETLWVPKTEEVRPEGFVDAETTEVDADLFLSGAMVRKDVFTEGYGLKSNIPYTFVNEFFRRIVARGVVARGMGKLLYLHRERRPGSYVYELMVGEKALSKDQQRELLELARTESAYEVQRPVTGYQL